MPITDPETPPTPRRKRGRPPKPQPSSWNLISEADEALSELNDAVDQTLEPLPRSDITVSTPNEHLDYQSPWDQLPDEPSTAYRQFLAYRDMGLTRTFTAAAKLTKSTQPSLSRQAKTFNWRHRAQAWDADQERLYQLARHEKVREMVDRHGSVIEGAIGHINVAFKALELRIESDPNFVDDLSKRDAKFLLNIAGSASRVLPPLMAAERLARDMPTEIVGGMVEHHHTVEIDQDSLGEVVATLARAGVLSGPGDEISLGEIVEAEVVDVHPVSDSGPGGEPENGTG